MKYGHGWCGWGWRLDLDDGQELRFARTEQHGFTNTPFELEEGEYIAKIRLRTVHTTSFEFGTNIVGVHWKTSKGRWFDDDAHQYQGHSSSVIELNLEIPSGSG